MHASAISFGIISSTVRAPGGRQHYVNLREAVLGCTGMPVMEAVIIDGEWVRLPHYTIYYTDAQTWAWRKRERALLARWFKSINPYRDMIEWDGNYHTVTSNTLYC